MTDAGDGTTADADDATTADDGTTADDDPDVATADADDGTTADDDPDVATADDPVRIALMCVQNAGRSQMATAFAERERDRRGLGDRVEILTGGTDPADSVHDVVVDVMAELGIDIADREPQSITTAQLESCDYVATMGCSTLELDAGAGVDVRDWALEDPHGGDLERVREIREQVEANVVALFDEFSDPPSGDGTAEGESDG